MKFQFSPAVLALGRWLRRFLAASLALVVFVAMPAAMAQTEAPESQGDLSIISWNIEWFPGKKNFARSDAMKKHAQVVSEVIAELNPDILLAQEIRDWESFARLCDVLPGFRPAVVSAFPSRKTGEYWRQQVAIGSKLPVMAAWSQPWQQHDDLQPPRGFSAAVVRLPGAGSPRYLLVYSLHLKSNLSESEEETQTNFRDRDESIRQLLEHVREMEQNVFKGGIVGVVVGGDFNTNHDGQFDDKVIELMKEAGFHHTWGDTPREQRETWRGTKKLSPTTFDHIFTKGLGQPQAELVEVPEETSDHRPVRIIVSKEDIARAKPPATTL
ncbi:MAG: endonuclease/exonuclease/phosphatase family protein [Chthoniobacterales bacterium]|nr:endonuclease/exonuclease/phosphatase family protein [Chthoniobacterales bacterium]